MSFDFFLFDDQSVHHTANVHGRRFRAQIPNGRILESVPMQRVLARSLRRPVLGELLFTDHAITVTKGNDTV